MKQWLRVLVTLTVLAMAGTNAAVASDQLDTNASKAADAVKGAKATTAVTAPAAQAACTAEMARRCTPEMAAACRAKGASASAACAAKASTAVAAVTASSNGCAAKATAVTASSKACPHATSAAAGKECPYHKNAAVTADHEGYGAAKTTPVAAGHAGCAFKASAVTASTPGFAAKTTAASAGCGMHKTIAVAAGSSCGSRARSAVTADAHANCDYCEAWSACEDAVKSTGAQTQVVKLKNGVAFIYTASSQAGANAVQAAVVQRNEREADLTRAGAKALLCPECKSLRQAVAAGKLTREVVNIEGGAMAIMTSTDAATVAKIHKMVGDAKPQAQTSANTKS